MQPTVYSNAKLWQNYAFDGPSLKSANLLSSNSSYIGTVTCLRKKHSNSQIMYSSISLCATGARYGTEVHDIASMDGHNTPEKGEDSELQSAAMEQLYARRCTCMPSDREYTARQAT